MKDAIVVVAGGAGTVGSGIVRAFVDMGARVVIPSRSHDRVAAVKNEVSSPDEVVGVLADIGTPGGAKEVADAVNDLGTLKHVVASLGGMWKGGRLRDLDLAGFQQAIHEYCGSHFVARQALLPLLEESGGGSYTFISGGVGEHVFDLDWGPVSVGAAALFGLSMVTRAEAADTPVRVNELRISTRVVREPSPAPPQVSHLVIGEIVAALAKSSTAGQLLRFGGNEDRERLLAELAG
jgi:NAD(P)-dependent dehydrogenase (short-subunit alcohol dehydrogenase family)